MRQTTKYTLTQSTLKSIAWFGPDLDSGQGLVGLVAACAEDAAGRATLAFIAEPHAPLFGLLGHNQLGFVQQTLQ